MVYYSLKQWLAFFFIYCFLGWCVESTIVSVTHRQLVNRGFLKGPILPLYGFGALTMLVATMGVRDHLVLVYIYGTLGATALEYVTGVLMEAMFKMKYWDYSDKKFNLNGYICLKSSLFWGVLTLVMVKGIHVYIEPLVLKMPEQLLATIVFVVLVVFLIDLAESFRKAFDFQKLLVYQAKMKAEIAELSARVTDVREAFSEISNEKQAALIRAQEARLEKSKAELENVKDKAAVLRDSILRSFPTASSSRFSEFLEELKQWIPRNTDKNE